MREKKLSVKGDFGRLLKSLRIKSNTHWTQKSLAAELRAASLKVSLRTYKGYEGGEGIPSPEVLKHIVALLELSKEDEDALYRAAAQSASEKEEPEIYHVPFLRNRFFTGREAYLDELGRLLQEESIVAVSGLGGMGKTQVALEYARRSHPDVYRVVLWVNAADTTTLRTDFASLAHTLKLPEQNERALERRIDAVKDWLREHDSWLLVMDNADELPIVEPFLLPKPCGHMILTTRWHPSVPFAKKLSLEVMSAEEGRNFLLKRTDRSAQQVELGTVDRLVEELGGYALALEQAGAYITETHISFANYLNVYEKNRLSLLSQYGALDDEHNKHRLTVATTFKGSLARAKQLSPLAEDILRFCAFLQPDDIPQELFEHDERFNSDTMSLQGGLAALQRYSLLKPMSYTHCLILCCPYIVWCGLCYKIC